DMKALLRLVSLGHAARKSANVRNRQPLAEMRVQPAGGSDRRPVERFADQIKDELNVKRVTLHDPSAGPLLSVRVAPNQQALGPKAGPRLNEVRTGLASAPAAEVAARVQTGLGYQLACPSGAVLLDPEDVVVQHQAPEGWAGVADRGTQVLLDVRLTEELA